MTHGDFSSIATLCPIAFIVAIRTAGPFFASDGINASLLRNPCPATAFGVAYNCIPGGPELFCIGKGSLSLKDAFDFVLLTIR